MVIDGNFANLSTANNAGNVTFDHNLYWSLPFSDHSSSGWSGPTNGVYTFTTNKYYYSLYEDGANKTKASSSALNNGDWYATYGSPCTYYYRPSSGTPANHELVGIGMPFAINGGTRQFSTWMGTDGYDTVGSSLGDQKFVNASGNFSQPSDFQLSSNSPAIDAGANVGLTRDFADTAVPQGSAPDIGAFEYDSGTPPPPPIYSKADLNQDNLVNLTDFNLLKLDFLKLTAALSNPRSDINGDGQATIRDVGIMMSGWGL